MPKQKQPDLNAALTSLIASQTAVALAPYVELLERMAQLLGQSTPVVARRPARPAQPRRKVTMRKAAVAHDPAPPRVAVAKRPSASESPASLVPQPTTAARPPIRRRPGNGNPLVGMDRYERKFWAPLMRQFSRRW